MTFPLSIAYDIPPDYSFRLGRQLRRPAPRLRHDLGTRRFIAQAEPICFPIGSFYTSLVACLLPMEIGDAVAKAGCAKVYVRLGPRAKSSKAPWWPQIRNRPSRESSYDLTGIAGEFP